MRKMKLLLVMCFCFFEASSAFEYIQATGENLKFAHQVVFDWMKVLTNQEIYALIAQKEVQWPTYDVIPPPSFSCADKTFSGFYADPATRCQTFHRCDINGNLTSYICVNGTVFNPITLICDHWFNVDCAAFVNDEYFANRRLYTNLPLFGGRVSSQSQEPVGQWSYAQDGAPAPLVNQTAAVVAASAVPVTAPPGTRDVALGSSEQAQSQSPNAAQNATSL